ncbi:MAG TPA: hydroxymethylbilane synthase [Methylomirabilota bacterium]|nr:hydroxymethylbilane synthase [Methylomirabilota bacterium]
MKVRVGTRGSPLALVQSEEVAQALRARGAEVELVVIRTSGDRLAQVALADFGGKALFVKEIEEALLAGQVDVGVHSLKDLPSELPVALTLGAFPPREDPCDILLGRRDGGWSALPAGAVVGTSSPRRRAMVLARRPDLRPEPIRGNVETRLEKLRAGAYDAIVVAAAGLSRLGLDPPHATPLDPGEFVPAVGQGVLAVEARQADRELLELLRGVDDTRTRLAALAERAFLARLGAGCHTPVAAHARLDDLVLQLTGVVSSPDGATMLRATMHGEPADGERLGVALAEELLSKGAKAVLDASRG